MTRDLANTIRRNAKGPRQARGDSGEMEQHSLAEQIEADRYLESKKASRARGLRLRRTKMVPPGAD